MGVVTSDLVKLVLAGTKTTFMNRYTQVLKDSIVPKLATVVDTTLKTQSYAWLSGLPAMREFKDERVVKALSENNYSITDKKWEATLGIERDALEDDQYGALKLQTMRLAGQAARHKVKIVVQQYALGATTVGPDGQFFIDTDHAESGTNQSNKSTAALSETELANAISAMQQFTDDTGEVMGIEPTHLLVGPKLQFTARKLLESTINVVTRSITASSSELMVGDKNVLEGMLDLVVDPRLTGTYDDYWFVTSNLDGLAPIILQERSDVPIEFNALDNPNNNEEAFLRDRFLYGVRGRYNVGYGLWQTVFGGIM